MSKMIEDLYRELAEIAGEENIACNEPMSRHVTFRTGGNALYFVTVESGNAEKVIAPLVTFLNQSGVRYYVIGNGSNLLFPDEGYDGVVVKLKDSEENIAIEGEVMIVGAGVLLSKAAAAARTAELSGMEFAAGIPGTVGGAVVMNAGAYGGEMKDIVEWADVLDMQGNQRRLSKEELDFSYRHSCIPAQNLIVTGVAYALKRGNREDITKVMEELAAKRREKQPLEYPSAGSTFKRPEGYFAGKLIEDAGLKGMTVGGAQVSQKHSGFVINRDHATTADILQLIKKVQDTVLDKFGVKLEMEVKVVK